MFVRKPVRGPSGWCVTIAEGPGPLDKVIERIECSSREHAWSVYRHVQRERGAGL